MRLQLFISLICSFGFNLDCRIGSFTYFVQCQQSIAIWDWTREVEKQIWLKYWSSFYYPETFLYFREILVSDEIDLLDWIHLILIKSSKHIWSMCTMYLFWINVFYFFIFFCVLVTLSIWSMWMCLLYSYVVTIFPFIVVSVSAFLGGGVGVRFRSYCDIVNMQATTNCNV